jgi:Arc/MetJ-type ribon-helix-helix transcriptional regulator
MKLSVSLPNEDIEFLDAYATAQGYPSRSAAVHAAIRLLRSARLGDDYAEAWAEWFGTDEADLWGHTAGDGLGDSR